MPEPPITPQIPVTPVVGTTSEQLGQQQQIANAKLRKMLEEIQADMQKKINLPFRRIYYGTAQKGSIVAFEYLRWHHDPYPLVLVSSIYTHPPRPNMLAGINLHYLTFKYIRSLLKLYCGKQFSYPLIRGNTYIKNAFRTYKKSHIRMMRNLDCDYLLMILGAVRSFNPQEIESIRKFVTEQLRKKMNPKAEDLAREYEGMILNDPLGWRYENFRDKIGKIYGKMPQPPITPPYSKITRGDQRRIPTDITSLE